MQERPQTEPNTETDAARAAQASPPRVRLREIFGVFFTIGALSFGGGLIAWLHRDAVERRKWLTPTDFVSALTLAQIVPGVNMANMAVYTGQRLRGVTGSATAVLGLLAVPFFAVLGLASVYDTIRTYPLVPSVLDGIATAAIGLFLSVTFKSLPISITSLGSAGILLAVVVAIALIKLPMVWVVLVAAPTSVWLAWRRLAQADHAL